MSTTSAGARRLRAAGRFACFVIAMVLVQIAHQMVLRQIPAVARWLDIAGAGSVSVLTTFVTVGSNLVLVLAVTALAVRLERRPLAAAGLPLRLALGRAFWRGALWGLTLATLTIALVWLLGGISFDGPSLG